MFAPFMRSLFASTLLLSAAVALAAEPDRYGDALPDHAIARIGTTRLRHGGAITSIVFAADGKTFATTSADRTVSVWAIESGRELMRCRDFAKEPFTAVFSADGKSLTCAAVDGTVRVFVVEAGKEKQRPVEGKVLQSFMLQSQTTGALAFSADASRLVAGDEDGKLQLWDMQTRKALVHFNHEGGVRCVALAPDGKTLASTSSIHGIQLWDTTIGKPKMTLRNGAYSVLLFSRNGQELIAGNFDNEIEIFGLEHGDPRVCLTAHREVMPLSKNGVSCLAYANKHSWLASGGGDGKVCVWDRRQLPDRKVPEQVFQSHTDRITAVAFSPDDRWLVSGAADNTIRLYDTATWKEVSPLSPEAPLAGLALSPDGKLVATIDTPRNRLALWDAGTGKPAAPLDQAPARASAGVFTPDGKALWLGVDGSSYDFWELPTGKKRMGWAAFEQPNKNDPSIDVSAGFVLDSRGTRLATTSSNGLFISVWNPATGKTVYVRITTGGQRAHALSLSPDGSILASAGPEATVRLWTLEGGKENSSLAGHSGGTLAVAFSPNGRLLATGGKDRMIRLWEVASGQARQEFGGQPGWVRAVAFSPDGTVLASANTEGSVRLWDLTAGRLLHELPGHRGSATRLAFSAKGEVLASASVDTTVLIWDTARLLKDRKPAVVVLTPKQLEKAWEQLQSSETGVASAALQTLAQAPQQTLPLLQRHVKPITEARFAKLLLDLDHDQFEVRQAAARELAEAGTFAEPILQTALKGNPSVEVRRSIEMLLENLHNRGPAPEELRLLRCPEVLEMLGGDEAKKLLATVAAGAKDAELTRQAKAALERLNRMEKGR